MALDFEYLNPPHIILLFALLFTLLLIGFAGLFICLIKKTKTTILLAVSCTLLSVAIVLLPVIFIISYKMEANFETIETIRSMAVEFKSGEVSSETAAFC